MVFGAEEAVHAALSELSGLSLIFFSIDIPLFHRHTVFFFAVKKKKTCRHSVINSLIFRKYFFKCIYCICIFYTGRGVTLLILDLHTAYPPLHTVTWAGLTTSGVVWVYICFHISQRRWKNAKKWSGAANRAPRTCQSRPLGPNPFSLLLSAVSRSPRFATLAILSHVNSSIRSITMEIERVE